MSVGREGWNLFRRTTWRQIWRNWKRGHRLVRREYVFRDTLVPIICWMSGGCLWHQPDAVEPKVYVCWWCGRSRPDEPT